MVISLRNKIFAILIYLILTLIIISLLTGCNSSTGNNKPGIKNTITDNPILNEQDSNSISAYKEGLPDDLIVDIEKIKGLKSDEIEALLGLAVSETKVAQGKVMSFSTFESNIEITFVSNQADWIKVAPKYQLPFDTGSLKYLNITHFENSQFYKDKKVIVGKNLEDYREITIHEGNNNYIDYFMIKSFTPKK